MVVTFQNLCIFLAQFIYVFLMILQQKTAFTLKSAVTSWSSSWRYSLFFLYVHALGGPFPKYGLFREVGHDVGHYSNFAWKLNFMDRIFRALYFPLAISQKKSFRPVDSVMYDVTLPAGNVVPSSNGGMAHTNVLWCFIDSITSSWCSTKWLLI